MRMRAFVAPVLIAIAAPLLAQATGPTVASSAATAPTTREYQAPSEELLTKLRATMDQIHTIQASFRQEKKLRALDHTMRLRGSLAVERPKRMAWHVLEPVRYSVIMQDAAMRQWDEDSDRVQTIRFADNPAAKVGMEQMQAWFLGDYKVVADTYDIVVTGEQPLKMRFTPRQENSATSKLIRRVDIVFTDDMTYLQTLVLLDGNGDTTRITFEDVRLNAAVPATTWEIPPRGR